MFILPTYNYEQLAKLKFFSDETIEFHVFQHHQGYINNLNKMLEGEPDLKEETLEKIIELSTGVIFNNAAQVWNHSFFWNSIETSKGSKQIPDKTLKEINSNFKSIDNFREEFKNTALANFGSGWTWLVKNLQDGSLQILNTSNALVPFKNSPHLIPILVCDIWEHAYYIDYRNKRSNYLDQFIDNINWSWVNKCLSDRVIQTLGVKENKK